jgi:hypothetical protein
VVRQVVVRPGVRQLRQQERPGVKVTIFVGY